MKHRTLALSIVALAMGCAQAPVAGLPGGNSPSIPPVIVSAAMSVAPTQAAGAPTEKLAPQSRLLQPATHHYRDGAASHPLWLAANTLAEFEPGDASQRELLLLDPLAEAVSSTTSGARIWRTHSPLGAEHLVQAMARAELRCSPVWRTVSAQEGELVAFPGGVLLEFPESWTDAERRDFSSAHSLRELGRPLDSDRLLLIDSPPGLEALELANLLADASPAVRCWPNTWRSYRSM